MYQSETDVLEQTANNLDSTCGQLLSCLSSAQDEQRLSPAESELRDIALKCTGSAKKLNDLLGKLRAKPRRIDALFKTIKAKWKQNEVNELQREVNEYQNALNTRMLTDLRLELCETQFQKQKSWKIRSGSLRCSIAISKLTVYTLEPSIGSSAMLRRLKMRGTASYAGSRISKVSIGSMAKRDRASLPSCNIPAITPKPGTI